jgi:hypothetical protein
MQVHFKKDPLVNILSLTDVVNLQGLLWIQRLSLPLTYFFGGKAFKFGECHDGLYYLDTSEKLSNYSKSIITN